MTFRRLPSPALPVLLALLAVLPGCQRPVESLFEHSTDAPSRTGLVAVGDGALVGNEAGTLLRLDAEGHPLWHVSLQREVAVPPVVAGDVVVAASVQGEWVGVGLEDGAVRWRQVDVAPPAAPPLAAGALVFVLTPEGGVRAVHAPSGGTAWERRPPAAARRTPGPSAPPALVECGGTLGLAAGTAGLVGLSTAEGERLWALPLHDVVGLTCADGRLLAVRAAGAVVGVDAASGKTAWTRALGAAPAAPSLSFPVVGGEHVWVGTGPRTLVGVPLMRAGPVRTLELPVARGAPAAVEDGVLVQPAEGREGRLVGLRLADGARLFELRVDSRLPTAPLLRGGRLWVVALDGRVLGFRLRPEVAPSRAAGP